MYFKKEPLEKFQTIYDDYFHQEINKNEAHQKAMKIFQLVKLLYKPMTKEQYETYKNTYVKN